MTETIDERPNPNDYSFSRLLDPLEIYDNNIRTAEPAVDMELLKDKISDNVEQAFERLKQKLLGKYAPVPPPTTAISNPEEVVVSHDKFKEFLASKMANVYPQ